jgi:hypothetical protein
MRHSFGKKPRDLQVKPCADLLAMAESMGDSYPSTYVLITPTSGGKSLVRDTVGRILSGVYWTICPLLSLSADQTEKLNEYKEQYGDNYCPNISIPFWHRCGLVQIARLCFIIQFECHTLCPRMKGVEHAVNLPLSGRVAELHFFSGPN